MRVRFTQDCVVKDHNGDVAESFTTGQVVDLPLPSARRWIRRKKAEEASASEPKHAALVAEGTTPADEPAPEETPDQGEAESQPEPGSEAGEETQPSSSQADQVSRNETSKKSGAGKRRRRRRATS